MPILFDGAFKGKSDSKFSGFKGSFAESIGVDGHSTPGSITVHQALAKESGTTVDEFVKIAVTVSTGESFWFSSTSGKIWRRSNASPGVWLLVYTTAPAAGAAGCLGAFEFNGYLYWATQSRLHRISMATAIATAANWTANAAPNWQTFGVTDASFHPMVSTDFNLFIGDGNKVAKVSNAGVFSADVLDITAPRKIKTMIVYNLDILIGTYVADTVNKTEIIRWDTVSPLFNTSDTIEEPGINTFIRDDNYVYANAGLAGNIYYYDGDRLMPFKRIPGAYTRSAYGLVHPGSVANFKGVPVFGFSNGSGNPAPQGVYSLGSYSRDYPKVLDLSFPISERSGGALVTSSIEIGAIVVSGFDLMVAWKNGTSYGVDVIDYSNKLTLAYFETMTLSQEKRDTLKTLANVAAYYNSLPASTGITFYYSINGAAYVAMTSVTNSILAAVEAQLSADGIGSLQIKVSFTVSGNTAPVIESLAIDFE